MTAPTPPRPSLRLVVAVIRSDGLIVKEIGLRTAMSRIIGLFLQKLPTKWIWQDKRDEKLAMAITAAVEDYRLEQMKIGLQPWVWTHKP